MNRLTGRRFVVVTSSLDSSVPRGHHGSTKSNTAVFRCRNRMSACERVLRYPDGHERRIRYPCDQMYEEDGDGSVSGAVCGVMEDEREDVVMVNEEDTSCAQTNIIEEELQADMIDDIPASPLEFLRQVTSEEYKEEQENEYNRVRNAFDIVADGCPWPIPKPVYTVICSKVHQDDGMNDSTQQHVHTLRTRVYQSDVESEMNKLLFGKRKNVIKCSSLVDGIVMFQDESQAVQYGLDVEKNLSDDDRGHHTTVGIAEHDSHALFRVIVEARGVAIVMKKDHEMYDSRKLAAVLRNLREE